MLLASYFIHIFIWFFFIKKILKFDLLRLNFLIFVLGFIILYNYLGYPFLYYELDKFRMIDFDTDVFKNLFNINIFVIYIILFTYSFFYFMLKKNNFSLNANNSLKSIKKLNKTKIVVILCLIILCFFIFVLYFNKIGLENIAFLNALKGADAITIAQDRSSMGNNFDGKVHRYQVFFYEILPFLFFVLFSNYLIKPSKCYFSLLVLIFFPTCFILLATANKAKLVMFFIGCFLTYCITKKNSKISLKNSILLFIISLSATVILYQLFNPNMIFENAVLSFFSRTFTAPISGAYHYLYYFPEFHDFLNGKTFPNPGGILPFESISVSQLVSDLINLKTFTEKNIRGSAPAIFWAEMYANFSYLGVILSSMFIGVTLFFLDFIVFRKISSSLKIGFLVWLLLHYQNLAITGFSKYFVDLKLIIILLVIFIILFLNQLLLIEQKK